MEMEAPFDGLLYQSDKKNKNRQYLVKFYRGECLSSPHTGYGGVFGTILKGSVMYGQGKEFAFHPYLLIPVFEDMTKVFAK